MSSICQAVLCGRTLKNCATLAYFCSQRTFFVQRCIPASEKVKLNGDKNETRVKEPLHLSISARRIYLSKKHRETQSHSITGSTNEGKGFIDNLNSINTEIDETHSNILHDIAKEDTDLAGSDYEDIPTEFITLPDRNIEATKKRFSTILGTEDHNVPNSAIPCSGCGAHLQCNNRTMPGFMASEYFKLHTEMELKGAICQRCDLMKHQDLFMEVSTTPAEYAEMIAKIKPTRSAVVMVVDVMDIEGSIVPNLLDYIGDKHPLVVVGNKADLLAPDNPDYLQGVRAHLINACKKAGLKHLHKCVLTSAKTGYGIERLITTLFSLYRRRVDVYIVGTANAGKSSLFNTLLGSDYCKHTARDLIQRATVSVWPGTTLNLLKFPIMRPNSRTVHLRHQRLKQKRALAREEARLRNERQLNPDETQSNWVLKDEVETTDIRTDLQKFDDETGSAWGQSVVSFQGHKDGRVDSVVSQKEGRFVEEEDYSESYWMYDTPGLINFGQVMNLLSPEENSLLVPQWAVVPRTAVMYPHQTLFVSGLARLDYTVGKGPLFIAVHTSNQVPIFIQPSESADKFYETHYGTKVLGVPIGDRARLDRMPSLVGREFVIQAVDEKFAAADIQFSSIGWVSLAPRKHQEVRVRAYTPGLKGLRLQTPALLPDFTRYRGSRITNTPFFRMRPPGSVMAKSSSPLDEDE